MPAVFLSNEMLQQWSDQGKVRLEDTTLTLVAENRTVALTPAVRFTALIDGEDTRKLLGKVKTTAQIVELGAEHYLDSVIYGDVGYTVVEGFLGDLSPAKKASQRATAPTASAPPTGAAPPEDGAFHENTDIKIVTPAPSLPGPAPAAVELPPVPSLEAAANGRLTEAEALSQLFLSTVKDKF